MNESYRAGMSLVEQAQRRVALAHDLGRTPMRWLASADVAAALPIGALCGLPIEVGEPRSEWGLDLQLAAAG